MHRKITSMRSSVFIAALLASTVSSVLAEQAGEGMHPAERRFRELVPRWPDDLPSVGEVVAFEEHTHFVYLSGQLPPSKKPAPSDGDRRPHVRFLLLRPGTLLVDLWPFDPKQHHFGSRAELAEVSSTLPNDKTSRRLFCVFLPRPDESEFDLDADVADDNVYKVMVQLSNRRINVILPLHLSEPARIAVESTDGKTILAERRLPDGVLPIGPTGMRLLDRWDASYRGKTRPPWDKGLPSTHLKTAVEAGRVKPGRAVVLGCGTGTNAIYLAQQGFDVTAIDVAPTALNLAEAKAKKADVKVRWLLADVLAPPAGLEPFDFIFDRGCYHGVRRGNSQGYVDAAKQLSRPETQILILAGNANEERHYGPPRVKEEDLRGDFAADFDFVRLDTVRFDSVDPDQKGALAWSALLKRKGSNRSHSEP